MVEPDGTTHHGDDINGEQERGRKSQSPSELSIPKNRSTGNLLAYSSRNPSGAEKGRLRFASDAGLVTPGEHDSMSISPVLTEHEHGLGASGLRRIRQQPLSRVPTIPRSGSSSRNNSIGPRSASMTTLSLASSRPGSMAIPSGPSSPTLNFTEDLTRFPSESLHSFSFAHQSEEFIHNRQNVLKRSVEFMSQKLGWGSTQAGIASAQARLSGDQEMQGMLDLLARAKLVGANNIAGSGQAHMVGPLTGPPLSDDRENIFDANFLPRSESPGGLESSTAQSSPLLLRKTISNISNAEFDKEQVSQDDGRKDTMVQSESEPSSRTPTNESRTTTKTSPPATRRQSLKRTYTDLAPLKIQNKLMEALARPFLSGDFYGGLVSPTFLTSARDHGSSVGMTGFHPVGPAVHGHSSRWAPAAQAIFTTESTAPYTILAANDLACLVFGVTKAEVRKIGIMEVVREEGRAWLEEKLRAEGPLSEIHVDAEKEPPKSPPSRSTQPSPTSFLAKQPPPPPNRNQNPSPPSFLARTGGVTAALLSRPNSRASPKKPVRSKTDDGAGSSLVKGKTAKDGAFHPANKSRGVLLCGDVVPIQKRNGATGSASLWVKEKRGGLIWVLEEIHEDVAVLSTDDDAQITKFTGSASPLWGDYVTKAGIDIGKLIPKIPRQGIDSRTGEIDYAELAKRKFFTARNSGRFNVPCKVERVPGGTDLRVSSFPHIAGIMVLSSKSLEITSSNSVFSAALFGQEKPDGRSIDQLIPDFSRILKILTEEEDVELVDGIVIPEHSFRKARAFLALRDGNADAASYFLHPDGLPAKHRDGSEIKIDAQLRVVKSESHPPAYDENVIEETSDEDDIYRTTSHETSKELLYALWITYSRHIHASKQSVSTSSPIPSGIQTPMHQPSPGQPGLASPMDMDSDIETPRKNDSHAKLLATQLKAAARKTAAKLTGRDSPIPKVEKVKEPEKEVAAPIEKKSIEDFIILEEMGQGAYGQVKLARYKKNGNRKIVLKYVTKRRILVDTWTRDRKLGTVPLEIHVLDYLRREGLKHPNIVEMNDFFEDDTNYYIEMLPHGLPGMDLFDYIELRVNMEENECRSIFVQVANAIHHLHTKAFVVHRDVKDENVVLDGEGNIKLIDFGSAAYIKNGPFDVFVGTIDYAAPEVLGGKSYRGKEQDVWALGILLYTIIYKENPFYSIDEIMDRDLRIPYIMSEDSIDLIRNMLDRDVESRITIEQVLEHPWCMTPGEED